MSGLCASLVTHQPTTLFTKKAKETTCIHYPLVSTDHRNHVLFARTAFYLRSPFLLLVLTRSRTSAMKNTIEGVRSIAPFIFGDFVRLSLAALLNLFNCITALASGGLVPTPGDEANITLGLFGFLVPVALAMATRMLPLYARIQPFPSRLLWILALVYFGGLIFWLLGLFIAGMSFASLSGLGLVAIGIVILLFTGYFLYLMHNRTRLPLRVATHALHLEVQVERARQRTQEERRRYGLYVALIGTLCGDHSAQCLWS